MSRRLKKEKIDLLTTDLYYRVLVGESVLRFSFTVDLLVEDEPAREEGRVFPLSNIVAEISPIVGGIVEKDKISIQGSLTGKAVFYGREGAKEYAWPEEEFYREAELKGALPGMELSARGRVVFTGEENSPLEAEGKLLYQLKIEIEVLLAVIDLQQLTVAVGAKDIAPERVSRAVLAVEELVAENAFQFDVTKETGFAEVPQYAGIVNCYLQDFSYEWGRQSIGLKGELVITASVLVGEKGSLQEIRQQFNHEVSFPEQREEGFKISLFPSIGRAVCNIDEKNVLYQVNIDVFARVTRSIQQEVISDIEGAAVKKEYLLLPKTLGIVKEPLELVQKLAFSYPRDIAAGFTRFQSLAVSPQEDRLSVSGQLEKKVYYLPAAERLPGIGEEEGPGTALETAAEMAEPVLPRVIKVEDDFLSDLYLPGSGPEVKTAAYFQPQGTEYVPTESDTLQISHLLLEIKAWQVQEVAVVVPSRVPAGTSMVIYAVKAGDTLLRIGRAYGLKPEVIAFANGLEEDADLEAGRRILIPLMFQEDGPG